LFQKFPQTGRFAVVVVEETRIAVDVAIGALAKNAGRRADREVAVKRGPVGPLNAMDRPNYLIDAVQLDNVADLFAGMLGDKTPVIERVPVLGCHHQLEAGRQLVGDQTPTINWDTYVNEVFVPIYEDTFTEEELHLIYAFYQSPLGQKVSKAQIPMYIRGTEESTKWFEKQVLPAI